MPLAITRTSASTRVEIADRWRPLHTEPLTVVRQRTDQRPVVDGKLRLSQKAVPNALGEQPVRYRVRLT